MSLILNIDTSSENAHVSFAEDGMVLDFLTSDSQKDHASFLHTAIQQLTRSTGIILKDIDAVAITAGPGSYTGLRVGMASAKGLCYVLKKPLITLGTLEVLTASTLRVFKNPLNDLLFCPMMDARRMEVFTAIYKNDLSIYKPASALILDETSFENELSGNKMLFFGTGSDKWKPVCKHPNAAFETVSILPESMSERSNILLGEKMFTELAYSVPTYLKEFQTVIKK